MIYKLAYPAFGRYFNVPCGAVENFIKTADGDFYKVLLCALCSDSPVLDTARLAERAGVSVSAAEDAMLFWTSNGVLRAEGAADTPAPAVSVQPAVMPVSVPAMLPAEPEKEEESVQAADPEKTEKTAPVKMTVKYSPKELAQRAAESGEIKALFEQVQKILGRPINPTETAGFLGLYEYYGFSVASIMILTQYAHDMGKDKIAYIEKVAHDWLDRGLTEYADVEREITRLTEQNKVNVRLKRLLGIEGKLTKNQEEFLSLWTEWGFDDDMISLADEICRDNKNRTDLRYMNGILKRWHDDGIKTPADVKEKGKAQYERKEDVSAAESSFSIDEWYELADNYDPEKIGLKEDNA